MFGRMFEDLLEFFTEIALPLVFVFGTLIAGVAFLGDFHLDYQCSNYTEITGKETRYARFDVCYVKEDDTWMRWDEYKAYIVASKGLEKVADL